MEYVQLTYEEILELGPRMSKNYFNKVIGGRKVYSSICLKNKMKVQVKVIQRNRFMQLKMNHLYTYVRHENHEYLFTYQTGGVDSNEGILLSSIGYYSLTNLEYKIDYDMVKAINSAYQEGQSRKRCKKMGWRHIELQGVLTDHIQDQLSGMRTLANISTITRKVISHILSN